MVERRVLHAHASVPVMEALEQQRLELQRVVGRRIGHAHHFAEHQQHEQVIVVPATAGNSAAIARAVALFEKEAGWLSQARQLSLRLVGIRLFRCRQRPVAF